MLKRKKQCVQTTTHVIKYFGKLNFPYKIMCKGVNRVVFDMGNGYVLKVAISIKGIKDYKIEAFLYKITPSYLKRHLGRVISNGNGWLLMRKFENQIPRTLKYKKKILHVLNKFVKRRISLTMFLS
jgi:hypothetical protein